MKRALLILGVVLAVTFGLSQRSSGLAIKFCATCVSPDGTAACWANYGEVCSAPTNLPHCTDAQAAAWCPGHA
jgi:hypothetical protein